MSVPTPEKPQPEVPLVPSGSLASATCCCAGHCFRSCSWSGMVAHGGDSTQDRSIPSRANEQGTRRARVPRREGSRWCWSGRPMPDGTCLRPLAGALVNTQCLGCTCWQSGCPRWSRDRRKPAPTEPPARPPRQESLHLPTLPGRPGRRQPCGSVSVWQATPVTWATRAWDRVEGRGARPSCALGGQCRPGTVPMTRARSLVSPLQRPKGRGTRDVMAAVAAPPADSAAPRTWDCRLQPSVETSRSRQPTSAGSRPLTEGQVRSGHLPGEPPNRLRRDHALPSRNGPAARKQRSGPVSQFAARDEPLANEHEQPRAP